MGILNHPSYAENIAPQYGIKATKSVSEIAEMVEAVRSDQVRYLCFEGGGGKGIVLLGAVRELRNLGILTYKDGRLNPNGQIKGLAGSSAGALMAVMLSIGFTPQELEKLVGPGGSYNLNRFLDLPYRIARRTSVKGYVKSPLKLSRVLKKIYKIWGIQGSRSDNVTRKLKRNFPRYTSNLFQHMGMFAGYEPIRFFDKHIAQRAARIEGSTDTSTYRNLTFKEHERIFKVKLVITGSNFATGKSELFSAETTPKWPVCVAAGNSMRIPIIYKPTVVSKSDAIDVTDKDFKDERALTVKRAQGVWVDGGYFNNLPIFAFASIPNAISETLGISISGLDSNKPKTIKTLWDFLGAYAELGFFGAGEAHVSATTGVEPNRINLKAGYKKPGYKSREIGLTDFNPDPSLVRRLNDMAQKSVRRYFENQ